MERAGSNRSLNAQPDTHCILYLTFFCHGFVAFFVSALFSYRHLSFQIVTASLLVVLVLVTLDFRCHQI